MNQTGGGCCENKVVMLYDRLSGVSREGQAGRSAIGVDVRVTSLSESRC